ncbi:hypothetical protein cyc_01213 [Cyclospora cayetanensis]|uniref:Uncharacterized protein n=1 Tax=Cyclospora cayetanensis TaxID=88456 RepID=A0A1D3CXM6_9EIME|nr:hypothetical protein cyc_01213 [Cyclospora cayetanensis]
MEGGLSWGPPAASCCSEGGGGGGSFAYLSSAAAASSGESACAAECSSPRTAASVQELLPGSIMQASLASPRAAVAAARADALMLPLSAGEGGHVGGSSPFYGQDSLPVTPPGNSRMVGMPSWSEDGGGRRSLGSGSQTSPPLGGGLLSLDTSTSASALTTPPASLFPVSPSSSATTAAPSSAAGTPTAAAAVKAATASSAVSLGPHDKASKVKGIEACASGLLEADFGSSGPAGGAYNLAKCAGNASYTTRSDVSASRVARLSRRAMELPYVHGVRFEAETFAWVAHMQGEARRFLVKKHGFIKSRLCAVEKIHAWRATLAPALLEAELKVEQEVLEMLRNSAVKAATVEQEFSGMSTSPLCQILDPAEPPGALDL